MNPTRPLASRMYWKHSMSGVRCRISIDRGRRLHFRYNPMVWVAGRLKEPITGFMVLMPLAGVCHEISPANNLWEV